MIVMGIVWMDSAGKEGEPLLYMGQGFPLQVFSW